MAAHSLANHLEWLFVALLATLVLLTMLALLTLTGVRLLLLAALTGLVTGRIAMLLPDVGGLVALFRLLHHVKFSWSASASSSLAAPADLY